MLTIVIMSVVIVLVLVFMVRTIQRLSSGWTFCSMPGELHLHPPEGAETLSHLRAAKEWETGDMLKYRDPRGGTLLYIPRGNVREQDE